MFANVISRLERAAEAFLAPVPAGPLRPPRHMERRRIAESVYGPVLPDLHPADREALQDQALGLLDPDVRGWLIVTVREHAPGIDIDIDWRIPDAAWPAVFTCIGEAAPEATP